MLRIRRSEEGGAVTLALSGRIEDQHRSELQALLDGEPEGSEIILDLQEVRLVDREVVRFLADCKARGIKIINCPSFVREWMESGGYTP